MVEGVGNVSNPLFLYYYFGSGLFGNVPSCSAVSYDQGVSCKYNNSEKVYIDSCLFRETQGYFNSNSSLNCMYCLGATGGIDQNNAQGVISISPNPAQNNFTVETTDTEKQTLRVYDINGKQVLSQTIMGKTNIDVSTFAQGVYNISVTGNYGVVNKRLIIVR